MSTMILPARGCTYVIKRGNDQSGRASGLFDVMASGGTSLRSAVERCLLQDVQVNDADLVQVMRSITGFTTIYHYGPTNTEIRVMGEILLGDVTQQSGGNQSGYGALKSWFDENRISASSSLVSVSTQSTAYRVALTTLAVGGVDVQYNNLMFALGGHLIQPPTIG